jgi:hypothetical protein
MSFGGDGVVKLGYWWHTARDVTIDTAIEPHWLRTGYRFFPYAALQAGHWWVIRVNFCLPEHDFAALFTDGAAVAEVTAAADAARALVASIGRLPLASPQRAHALPLMAQEAAQRL